MLDSWLAAGVAQRSRF